MNAQPVPVPIRPEPPRDRARRRKPVQETALVAAGALLALGAAIPGARAQDSRMQVPVCTTQDQAQLAMQAGPGAPLPRDCRHVTVRRMDTPAGPVCLVDFGGDDTGIVGTLREATTTTQWWTACANLRAPGAGAPVR